MAFLGWVVKEITKDNPRGVIASGNFATKEGAETLLRLLEKQAKEGATYFVTGNTRKDKWD